MEHSPIFGVDRDSNVFTADGDLVCLRKADVALLGHEAAGADDSNSGLAEEYIDRIIVGNTARDSAVQLLGPVGKDMWEDARVRIEDNTASGNAVQFAYPTDFNTFRYLLDHRERMAAIEMESPRRVL